jgi:hypothetical protein
MIAELTTIAALVGLAVLRLGMPVVVIWLAGKALQYLVPAQS